MYEFNSYVIVKCFTVTVAVYECVFGCVCGSSVLFFLLFFLKKTTDELCHSGFSYSDFLTTIYQALRFQYFDIKLFHFAFQFISYLFRSRSLSLSLHHFSFPSLTYSNYLKRLSELLIWFFHQNMNRTLSNNSRSGEAMSEQQRFEIPNF